MKQRSPPWGGVKDPLIWQRVAPGFLVRGGESLSGMAWAYALGTTMPLAADEWHWTEGWELSRQVNIKGDGYGTLLQRASAGITALLTISASNITIEGLRLLYAKTGTCIGVNITGSNVTLRDCWIDGFYTGVKVTGAAGFVVERCRIDNQVTRGIYVTATATRGRIAGNMIEATGTDEAVLVDPGATYVAIVGNNAATGDIIYTAATGNVDAGNVGAVTVL